MVDAKRPPGRAEQPLHLSGGEIEAAGAVGRIDLRDPVSRDLDGEITQDREQRRRVINRIRPDRHQRVPPRVARGVAVAMIKPDHEQRLGPPRRRRRHCPSAKGLPMGVAMQDRRDSIHLHRPHRDHRPSDRQHHAARRGPHEHRTPTRGGRSGPDRITTESTDAFRDRPPPRPPCRIPPRDDRHRTPVSAATGCVTSKRGSAVTAVAPTARAHARAVETWLNRPQGRLTAREAPPRCAFPPARRGR